MGWPHATWARYATAVLTTPVVFWAGWPFIRSAVVRARARTANMDTLIALGTVSAFAFSTFELLAPGGGTQDHGAGAFGGHLHYDTAALIVAFLLLGRFIEARVKGSASGALRALLELGAGFNPALTGRANVILHGTILGLTPRQILDFYLEEGSWIFVDRYRTGMFRQLVSAKFSPSRICSRTPARKQNSSPAARFQS